ncbi:MAG TPA: hypothetical protein VF506_09260, partial [Streptosporangiaceae bacterium]
MTAPNSLLWPRMGSVRMLLIAVLAATVIVATTVAADAGFAAGALPGAVGNELARSGRTTISIYGGFRAQEARIDRPSGRGAAARLALFGVVVWL